MTKLFVYAVDCVAGRLPRVPHQLRSLAFGAESSQRHVGLPELARVVDRLRHHQGLAQSIFGVVPVAPGKGELASKPPPLHEVFPRPRAAGSLQAFIRVPACPVEVI